MISNRFLLKTIIFFLLIGCFGFYPMDEGYAWFRTGQNADIILNDPGFNNAGYLTIPGDGLLFNHPMGISTDGTHLLLADTRNNRVLIWNSLPTGNVSPDIVLGQDSLSTNDPGTDLNRMNWPVGVSTGGGKVVVSDTNNNRILIWNSFPTYNGQPADLTITNLPPPAPARGFDTAWPWGIWTDGTKLIVCATQAGSVLIWNSFPTANNQLPDLTLYGKEKNTVYRRFSTPRDIGTDGRTYLVIGDHNASPTTMFWNSFPTVNDQAFDFAMDNPAPSTGDPHMRGGQLTPDGKFVIQTFPEISIWNSVPTSATTPDLFVGRNPLGVIEGQDERCTSDGYYFNSGDGSGVAITPSGRIYLSLINGNRVVGYYQRPTSTQQCPDFVIGSPDLATNTYSRSYISNPIPATDGTNLYTTSDFDSTLSVWTSVPTASSVSPNYSTFFQFDTPTDLALSQNRLVLASKAGGVHIYTHLPPAQGNWLGDIGFEGFHIGTQVLQSISGTALDSVYFYLSDGMAGKIYVWLGLPNNSSAPIFSLNVPNVNRISSDGRHLTAIDITNHKVLIYDVATFSSSSIPVASVPATGASYNFGLGPGGALVADNQLFIADSSNQRVLAWKNIESAIAGHNPDVVLGRPNLSSSGNYPAIGRNRLFNPNSLAYANGTLWVGEFKFSSRLLGFNVMPDTPHTLPFLNLLLLD